VRISSQQLSRFPELLKPDGEALPVGVIFPAPRQTYQTPGHGLQPLLQKWAVVQIEKPVGDMDSEVRVDADQLRVEGSVVNLRQRQPICDPRLTHLLVGIGNDMGRVEELRLRQPRDGTAFPVRAQHGVAERHLV